MSEPTVTRRAGPDDVDAMVAIEAEVFEPQRRSSPASLRRSLRSRFQRVWVAEVGADLAGYVIVWPFRHTWRIYNLAAHPGHRQQGVGGALLATVVAAAVEAGARRLVLESRVDPDLVGFYRRRGFEIRRRLADYYGPGEDGVRMERSLAAAG